MQTGELLAKVRKIEIKTRKVVEELTSGAYHSVFKGRGIEFSEVREYTPEDDVRDIDWNVSARMGMPFIKKYSEERELTVLIAVDVSASGMFGSLSGSKRETMIEAAALLALSAIRNNDKAGLLLFSDSTQLYLTPKSGKKHVLRMIRELVAETPRTPGTDIGQALDSIAEVQKKRAVIFLISDFIDEKDYEKKLKIVGRKHDLIAIRVLDPAEIQIPRLSGLHLEDAEDGENFYFDASAAINVRRYAEAESELRGAVAERCAKARVDLIDMRCGEDLVRPLMTFFGKRSRAGGIS